MEGKKKAGEEGRVGGREETTGLVMEEGSLSGSSLLGHRHSGSWGKNIKKGTFPPIMSRNVNSCLYLQIYLWLLMPTLSLPPI